VGFVHYLPPVHGASPAIKKHTHFEIAEAYCYYFVKIHARAGMKLDFPLILITWPSRR
jgi:hypothetical protein